MDLMRKMFLFGLGAMTVTAENARNFFDEMVARGEMNSDEAKTYFDDLVQKGDEQRCEIQAMIGKEMESLRQKMGMVTAKDLDEIKQRLEEIEKKLGVE